MSDDSKAMTMRTAAASAAANNPSNIDCTIAMQTANTDQEVAIPSEEDNAYLLTITTCSSFVIL